MSDSVARFSNRADNYARYRPGYPLGVMDILRNQCGLTDASVVADIGSGTGILSELFLRNGNTVFAIEPNAAMRQVADRLLGEFPNFLSIDATAEATTLDASSVDLVTAAQAFHWFDRDRARKEFARILRPGGWVALIWNERRLDSTAFLRDYEQLLLSPGKSNSSSRPRLFSCSPSRMSSISTLNRSGAAPARRRTRRNPAIRILSRSLKDLSVYSMRISAAE
jgi:SAM-dependent methyltransferase